MDGERIEKDDYKEINNKNDNNCNNNKFNDNINKEVY